MKIDQNRSDAWYLAIGDFLETNSGSKDVESPGALIDALCRVLADASESMGSDPRKKVEMIATLAAHAMGMQDVAVAIREPVGEPSRELN
ncbi:MAG: hypothetical protein BWY99_02419 [Synergistetes bacterium ADurb.BinA166]|nr:MAG: hypothetical protein BWY99_02419 [Synergistetes bacterium ADurb.BinA166]